MKEITVTNNKGEKLKKYLFDIAKENCPLCDTPIREAGCSWNMFHGEVNRHCCNSPWQTKDFSPPDGEAENYATFFKELNKDKYNQLKIDKSMWKPIREAFEVVGVKDCRNSKVFEYVKGKYPELFN